MPQRKPGKAAALLGRFCREFKSRHLRHIAEGSSEPAMGIDRREKRSEESEAGCE